MRIQYTEVPVDFYCITISGNWGVDLEAGSEYGYKLLFVVLLAGLFAVFLQVSMRAYVLLQIPDLPIQDISQPPWMRHRTRCALQNKTAQLWIFTIFHSRLGFTLSAATP